VDEREWEVLLRELEHADDPHKARARLVELLAVASQAGARRSAASAAFILAHYHTCMFEFEAAAAMCDRVAVELADIDVPVERARLTLAGAHLVVDGYPDESPLREALPVLEGDGRWAEASSTAALLAEAAARNDRVDLARHYFARAIGAAEAQAG
jgi:hypothetical protein